MANSTDRKSGHCLLGADGNVYAIDNGLSFHQEFKLRTVIWEFGGEEVPEHIVRDVERFVAAGVPDELAALLDPFERDALLAQCTAGLVKRLLQFTFDDPAAFPWGGEPVTMDGRNVGEPRCVAAALE